MNPNNPSMPSNFELPAPEVGGAAPGPEVAARPETAPLPPQTMPTPQPQATAGTALPPATAPIQMPSSESQQAGVAPTMADDSDLIEKEWVEKAKAIVAATNGDPRAQSRELNRFKADYMQKRYNKAIKVDES
jgi:hypothetical protein